MQPNGVDSKNSVSPQLLADEKLPPVPQDSMSACSCMSLDTAEGCCLIALGKAIFGYLSSCWSYYKWLILSGVEVEDISNSDVGDYSQVLYVRRFCAEWGLPKQLAESEVDWQPSEELAQRAIREAWLADIEHLPLEARRFALCEFKEAYGLRFAPASVLRTALKSHPRDPVILNALKDPALLHVLAKNRLKEQGCKEVDLASTLD